MILIVDDRPENILPLKKILELHGFSVDSAESGEEALKKVLENELRRHHSGRPDAGHGRL
jgi:CheY-like chemotaxis protein